MSEPEVEAVKLDESKESDAITVNTSSTVLNVEAGDAVGVREPAVTTEARKSTEMNAESVGRANRYRNNSRTRGLMSLGLSFWMIPSMMTSDLHVFRYPSPPDML